MMMKKAIHIFRYKAIIQILLGLTILIVISTVFVINEYLADSIVFGKYFWFYISMALFSVISIPAAVVMKFKKRLIFKLPDLLILAFCSIAILITLKHTGSLTNKCLLLGFLMLFYYYLRIFLSSENKFIYRLCCIFFIVTGLVEAVWGLMQLYGFLDSQHQFFRITGSFFNPGPYAGWIAMILPLTLGYAVINFKNSRFMFVLCSLTVLFILFVLPATMSRASWLATLGGNAFIGIMYFLSLQRKKVVMFRNYLKKYRKKVIFLSIVAVMLLASSMTGLFLLKKDSAYGRAFIWKISLQTIKEHSMGVGLGNFSGSYGDTQAAYFASDIRTEREQYVADGTEYAFNEYLQICIETGIIPFCIFLTFVICVLYLGIKNKNYLPAGSLVSVLIFASMSYPFNILPFVIAFVFLSALCVTNNNENNEKTERKRLYPQFVIWTFLIVALVTVASCTYKIYPLYKAYKQWNEAKILYGMNNMHKEVVKEYAKQYPYLQNEKLFLVEYAQSLTELEQYEKSNEILRQAMQISCDPGLYNIMGYNYQALKEYELAEHSFIKAANLVPNRLYPHYMLAKLYYEMGLRDKAEAEVNIVMTKTPKVESMMAEKIREELKELFIDKIDSLLLYP
jgi:tetratricopeptide (TPR) repeat protein